MATDVTIEDYLDALRRRWHRRSDCAELLDEMEDHLRSRMEDAVARGADPAAAEVETVLRFGDADAIAEAVADANGGPAVPTPLTRAAGGAALAAGGAWLTVPALWWWSDRLDDSRPWEGLPQVVWMVGAMCLTAAVTFGVVVLIGLIERHGGLGWPGRLSLVPAVLSVPAALVVAWAVPVWATLVAITWLTVGVALLRRGIAPVASTVTTTVAWPIGLMTFAVLRANEFGAVDEWGDYPAATLSGLAVGAVLMAIGSSAMGWWLLREEAVDVTLDDAVAA